MPTAAAPAMTGGAVLGIVLLAFAGAMYLGWLFGTWNAHRVDRRSVETATAAQARAENARDRARLDRDNALQTATGLRAQLDTANLQTVTAQRALDTYAGQYAQLYRRFAAEMRHYGVDIDGSSLTPHPSPITDPHGFTVWWRRLTGAP